MLTTLPLSLQPGLARAALCAAPLLLQRVAAASTAAAAGIHETAGQSQQHHKPAHKQKGRDAFSITPFLAKPGQTRQNSVEAVEWSDRWAPGHWWATPDPLPPLAARQPCARHLHLVLPAPGHPIRPLRPQPFRRLRRLDFGLPRGPRYARNVAAASPCKPIASAHPGFRHSHHELNMGIASHLAQPHFQASNQ
jgi:hypothetical protein